MSKRSALPTLTASCVVDLSTCDPFVLSLGDGQSPVTLRNASSVQSNGRTLTIWYTDDRWLVRRYKTSREASIAARCVRVSMAFVYDRRPPTGIPLWERVQSDPEAPVPRPSGDNCNDDGDDEDEADNDDENDDEDGVDHGNNDGESNNNNDDDDE